MIAQLLLISIISFSPAFVAESVSPEAEEVIIEMALKSVQENYSSDEYHFSISPRWIPATLRHIQPNKIKAVEPQGYIQKYTRFEVTYAKTGGTQKAEIQLKVVADQKVPVLKERKLQGEKLSKDDFHWKWITVDLDRDHPISDVNQLNGKTLRRSLKAGQFISDNEISTSFMVEAGEVVDMVYTENGLQIVLSCEARQDGAAGEEIQIYCKETRKKYLGKIKGPGEVTWLKTQ